MDITEFKANAFLTDRNALDNKAMILSYNAENVGLLLIHFVILSSPSCVSKPYDLLSSVEYKRRHVVEWYQTIFLTLLYVQNVLNFSNYILFYVSQ